MRGTQRHPSRVLTDREFELAEESKFLVPLACELIKVPKRYREDFERRTATSLMNIAGQASLGQEIPCDDLTQVEDFSLCPVLYFSAPLGHLRPLREQFPKDYFIVTPQGWRIKRFPGALRYLACDLADVGEAAIAVIHKELSSTARVMYIADFIIKLSSPNRIFLEAVMNLVIDLRDYYGLRFHSATADQYQSTQLLQKLEAIHFAQEIKVQSVDKTRIPYDTLASIVAEGSLKTGRMRELKQQLEGIYFDNNKPFKQLNTPGHADMADALCQAVFAAVNNPIDVPTNLYEHYKNYQAIFKSLEKDFQEI
jgi:hypothetical protein